MNIYDIFEELGFIVSEYDEPKIEKEIEIILPINYYYAINNAVRKELLLTSIVDHNLLEPNITTINSRSGVTFTLKIKEFDYE